MIRRPPRSTLFPSPTSSRSLDRAAEGANRRAIVEGALARLIKSEPAALMSKANAAGTVEDDLEDRKSTRLNSSHSQISYAVFCLKKKHPILMLVITTTVLSS